jgi:P-type Ca2+ transporter type 2C
MTSSSTTARAVVPAQLDFHTLSIHDTLAAEEVDEQRGLSTAQAEERLRTFGPNRFAEGAKEPR